MFEFDLSDELKLKMGKLAKKDRRRVELINNKIREIIDNDRASVQRYKNLRHGMKHLKRVHVDRNFVLTFMVDEKRNFILFADFDHHDKIYRR